MVDVWFGCVGDGRVCGGYVCGYVGSTSDWCGCDWCGPVRSGIGIFIGILNGYLSETMVDEGLAVFEVGVRHRLHLRL